MVRVSMTMIVRDEAQMIARCLDSFWDHVDEVVIVDTGSKDGTMAELRAYAHGKGEDSKLVLIEHPWSDDFSAARRVGWDRATGDWLSWIDADDQLVGAANLRALAEQAAPACNALVMDYDYAQDPATGRCVCLLKRERLVRRGVAHWIGRVHEALIFPEGSAMFVEPAICHWRHGKAVERLGRSSPRNRRILKAWLADEPHNPRVLGYLGTEYLHSGKPKIAVGYFRRYLRELVAWDEERAQMHRRYAIALMAQGRQREAQQLALQALTILPSWPDSYLTLAEAHYNLGEHAKAIEWVDQVLARGMPTTLLIINPLDYSFQPRLVKAGALGALGRWQEALTVGEQALELFPHHGDLQSHMTTWRAQAKLEETAKTFSAMAQVLVQHDEQLKAQALLDAVPHYAESHPLVVSTRANVRERILWSADLEDYAEHYRNGGSKPEDFVPDDKVDLNGDALSRVQFALEALESLQKAEIHLLDLGAHDGWISLYLARRLREKGIEVHTTGIELNPKAAKAANRRFLNASLPGNFRVGHAEDVATLCGERRYDAVLCFELIEHVADVDVLLAACEWACAPDGIVLVSTPDGTFGAGNNPHHLRCYTSAQLSDLLRHRGTLENAIPGTQDGVTTVAYRPASRRGDVAIYCGPGWERWSPMDIEVKGLGGSETAAVRLADALSGEGYVVTVYGECERCAFRDVLYAHHTTFDPTQPRQVVIVSRQPEMLDRRLNASKVLLWLHDTDCGPRLTPQRAQRVDHVMVLSEWHESHIAQTYPFLEGKLHRTGNAIEPAYFDFPEEARRPVCLYTSSPDRGLDVLLDLWPAVRLRLPEAELHHAYAPVYDRVADADPRVGAHRARIRELAAQPGVVNLGHLTQPQVAKAMRGARVWAHPSFATPFAAPFYETYCIGALEAAAAGCWAVASDWGGLAEREFDGVRIAARDNDPRSERETWVDQLVAHLTREDLPDPEYRRAALSTVWARVALDFIAVFDREAVALAA